MKQIKNYPNYFITKRGKIYRKKSNGELRLKKPKINNCNYLCIGLYKDGIQDIFYISRLVAIAYVPNPNNYPCVLHKDNNTLNNYYKNLKWGTHSMNMKQCHRDGRGYNFWIHRKNLKTILQ